ncbi:MAG TPA: hypothetical protein VJ957_07900 [Longimicrobiales bacterium]|nr:hypothetical protein [Longimicrobiales bacterium]
MFLRCSYEELTALTTTARRVLGAAAGGGGVVAPPEIVAEIEALLPRLDGDVDLTTLAEEWWLERILDYLLTDGKERMDGLILDQYVGAEDAVNAYFDYANVLTVQGKVHEIGREMAVLIELMTGHPPTSETARSVTFPD